MMAGRARLRLRDVSLGDKQMSIFLRRSKMDQEGERGDHSHPRYPKKGRCAVHRMRRLLQKSDPPQRVPIQTVFRTALHQAGLPAPQFGHIHFG